MKRTSALTLLVILFASNLFAEDWPTYRHDSRRSGVSPEELTFPLRQSWVRRSAVPPQTAWTGPAKWDAWAGNSGLQSMRNFDPCFYVTATDQQVFFGSSVDDAVHALDAKTGAERWVHMTGAAVRFPPTLAGKYALFGSDDGYAYCVDRGTGDLIWKRRACINDQRITSNGKIISLWPVRTGVVVDQAFAIFAGSLVPWKDSFLCKVDLATGQLRHSGCFRKDVGGVTLQGALLTSASRIYVPQGRAAPLAFDLKSGSAQGAIGEAGGVFCVLTEDEMLIAGPQNQKSSSDQIRIADGSSRKRLASFAGANRILVHQDRAWIPTNGRLKCLDRAAFVKAQIRIDQATKTIKDKKKANDQALLDLAAAKKEQAKAWKWDRDCDAVHGFIKSGNAILVGHTDEIRAYAANTGKLLYVAKIEGVAHGLAVADGRLFVSTVLGHIYAFEQE